MTALYVVNSSGSTYPTSSTIWNSWITSGSYQTPTSATNFSCSNNQQAWAVWTTGHNYHVMGSAARLGVIVKGTRPDADSHVTAWKEFNRRMARFRSLRLLVGFLSKDQRRQLHQGSYFDVVGGETGDIYRIFWKKHDSMIANVQVMGKGRPYAANDNWKSEELKHVLCAHLNTGFLIGDQLLTQKLMIEKEEKHFLKIANKHSLSTKQSPSLTRKAA